MKTKKKNILFSHLSRWLVWPSNRLARHALSCKTGLHASAVFSFPHSCLSPA